MLEHPCGDGADSKFLTSWLLMALQQSWSSSGSVHRDQSVDAPSHWGSRCIVTWGRTARLLTPYPLGSTPVPPPNFSSLPTSPFPIFSGNPRPKSGFLPPVPTHLTPAIFRQQPLTPAPLTPGPPPHPVSYPTVTSLIGCRRAQNDHWVQAVTFFHRSWRVLYQWPVPSLMYD